MIFGVRVMWPNLLACELSRSLPRSQLPFLEPRDQPVLPAAEAQLTQHRLLGSTHLRGPQGILSFTPGRGRMEADGTGGCWRPHGGWRRWGAKEGAQGGRGSLGCALRLTLSPLARRRASLRLQLAGLQQEVRALRRAGAALPHTHGGKEVQLPHLRQALHAQRPPDQARAPPRQLPPGDAAAARRGLANRLA